MPTPARFHATGVTTEGTLSTLGNTATALALGASGGLLLWYLTRGEPAAATGSLESENRGPPGLDPGASKVRVPAPAKVAAPCSLKLDRSGLTADGERVDIPTAVARCKVAGRAELVFASDGPATVYVDLNKALARAGVAVTLPRS